MRLMRLILILNTDLYACIIPMELVLHDRWILRHLHRRSGSCGYLHASVRLPNWHSRRYYKNAGYHDLETPPVRGAGTKSVVLHRKIFDWGVDVSPNALMQLKHASIHDIYRTITTFLTISGSRWTFLLCFCATRPQPQAAKLTRDRRKHFATLQKLRSAIQCTYIIQIATR